jgi:hypothetical protein
MECRETQPLPRDIWQSHVPPLLLLTFATLLTFASSLGHEFVTEWDDQLYVTLNHAAWGFSIENLYQAFTSCFGGNYAPLQIVSYMLDSTLWGLRPAGFIFTNVLLHLANGLLYYQLVWKLTGRRCWSFAAAAIFLLHPVQVESAVWVSQRKNVLSMCFFLLSVLLYLKYKDNSGNKRIPWYAGSIAAFLGALLTKSVVVILPLVLLVHDLSFLDRKNRGRWLVDKVPYLILSVIIGVVTLKSQTPELGGGISVGWHGGSPVATFYTMITLMARYMYHLFWPVGLSAFYGYPIKSTIDAEVIGTGILLLILAVGICYLALSNRRLFFWAALIVLGILPVSQIIPLVTMMNDRYFYFPMLGAAALIIGLMEGLVVRSAPLQRRIIIPVLLIVLVSLPVLSINRARVWQNSFTLWTDACKKFPNHPFPCSSLGSIYLREGELLLARDYLLHAYQLGLKTESVVLNLGRTYLSLGDLSQAKLYIDALINKRPNFGKGFMLLGEYRRNMGDEAGAAEAFSRALALESGMKP